MDNPSGRFLLGPVYPGGTQCCNLLPKMNRKFARLLAVVFGFTLLFEVACLPLLSSFSLQVEKSMFAAGTELDELDEAEKGFDLLPCFKTQDFGGHSLVLIHSESSAANHSTQIALPAFEPAFIQFHSLRI